MINHLATGEIDRLILGLAEDAELDRWLDHIEVCEACFELVDQTWPGGHLNRENLVPSLDPKRLDMSRRRIFAHIHGEELIKESIRLMLIGPVAFLQGMLGSRPRFRR